MERERVHTRNFRHPINALPPGTVLESPTGMSCRVLGPSLKIPGRIAVVFTVNGMELSQHVWPSSLLRFKLDGVEL